MTRLLKLVTVIFAIISLASAQVVDTLNTPSGPVNQGAKVAVTWSLLPGVDATGKTGDLSATDSTSKNVIPIDPAVPLAPKSYLWEVKVPPGTYFLGLNDGSGLKQTAEVVVKAPSGPVGSGTPAPGPGASPAPAPAPAPAPGTGGTSKAPAAGAGTTAGSPPSTTGAGGSTPADGGSSTPPAGTPTPSSGSLIFSGYEVVFSLLCVAIAMVQF